MNLIEAANMILHQAAVHMEKAEEHVERAHKIVGAPMRRSRGRPTGRK
jgi:hypothetical protein